MDVFKRQWRRGKLQRPSSTSTCRRPALRNSLTTCSTASRPWLRSRPPTRETRHGCSSPPASCCCASKQRERHSLECFSTLAWHSTHLNMCCSLPFGQPPLTSRNRMPQDDAGPRLLRGRPAAEPQLHLRAHAVLGGPLHPVAAVVSAERHANCGNTRTESSLSV